MRSLLSIPVPFIPYAFASMVIFALILVADLVLVAFSKSFRRKQLTAFLVPIGIIVLSLVGYYSALSYYIPHQIIILGFITVTTGTAIPILYAERSLLGTTRARLLLSFSGLVEFALGLNRLSSFTYFYPFSDVVLVIVFSTVGTYSIAASALSACAQKIRDSLTQKL
jgi:hypothetical protein